MGGVVSAIGSAIGGVVNGVADVVGGVGDGISSLLGGGGGSNSGTSSSSSTSGSSGSNTTNNSTTNNSTTNNSSTYNYNYDEGLKASANATLQVADMQKQSATDYLNFQKQQYNDLLPLAQKVSQAQLDSMKQQSDIASQNEARAQDYANYDKTTFRPLEQGLVDEANSYDTKAKQEEMARQGIADVAQAYDTQRQQALDTLSQYGVNPNSNRFAAINAQLNQGEAAAKAGVATNARTNAEQLGYARKLDAASLGRGLASNASTAYGVSLNASNSANASGSNALSSAYAPGNTLSAGYQGSSSMLGNAANSYYGAGTQFARGYGIQNQATSANYGALGSLAGQVLGSNSAMSNLGSLAGSIGSAASSAGSWLADAGAAVLDFLADGGQPEVHKGKGRVRGIGGPVDDKVPAMLSNGEYVLPADTVKAIGIKKLDRVVKKTHTPAAVQRRRAIQVGG